MEQGWDPDVKRFLLKVLNSISWVLLWMLAAVTSGIYMQLGYFNNGTGITPYIFYTILVVTFLFLIRYLYRKWSK